jgi:hypothetical protein
MVQELALVIISRHEKPYSLVPKELSPQFTINGEVFVEAACAEWLGFYDWLLSVGDLKPIRLELTIDDPEALDLEKLAALNGVTTESANRLIVHLSDRGDVDERRSALQCFLGNRLFYGDKDSVALSFFAP